MLVKYTSAAALVLTVLLMIFPGPGASRADEGGAHSVKAVSLTFDAEDFTFSKSGRWDVITYGTPRGKNVSYVSEVGSPMLPIRYVRVLLPPDAEMTGFTAEFESKEPSRSTVPAGCFPSARLRTCQADA
jgi:hypothetical protein